MRLMTMTLSVVAARKLLLCLLLLTGGFTACLVADAADAQPTARSDEETQKEIDINKKKIEEHIRKLREQADWYGEQSKNAQKNIDRLESEQQATKQRIDRIQKILDDYERTGKMDRVAALKILKEGGVSVGSPSDAEIIDAIRKLNQKNAERRNVLKNTIDKNSSLSNPRKALPVLKSEQTTRQKSPIRPPPTPHNREPMMQLRDALVTSGLDQYVQLARLAPDRVTVTERRNLSPSEAQKIVQIVRNETAANPGLVIELPCSIARSAGQQRYFLGC